MGKQWQVVCVQDLGRRHIVDTFDDQVKADAKAARLNKRARGTVTYIVEEVADESANHKSNFG